MKKPKELERMVRGFSNHRRIEMMDLIENKPELSVVLRINFKTASDHIRRLAITGLVMKRNDGNAVRHALTHRGKSILMFLRTLE
jgi:predicted transcriptional regulator